MLALSAALALAFQSLSWTAPKSAIFEGNELFAGAKAQAYRLTVEGRQFAFTSRRGIGLWPGAGARTEINTDKGIFTWIEGYGRVLALPAFSQQDVPSWVQPVRFSRDTVANDRVKDWKLEGSESVAGRACLLLKGAHQKLWIDNETGLTLLQKDPGYERSTTSARVGETVPAGAFEAPSGSLTIWGVPDPSILSAKSLDRPNADYAADMKAILKKSKVIPGSMLWKLPPVEGYTYVQTVFRENEGKPVAQIWPSNRLGQPEIEPGGLPPGWTVSGELNAEGNGAMFTFQTGTSTPRVMIGMPSAQGDKCSFAITMEENGVTNTVQYCAFLAPDGALVISPGFDAIGAMARREQRRLQLSKANVVVQSDLIDKATGHTVSFLQVRGRDWQSVLLLPKLPEPQTVSAEPFSAFKTYTVPGWFPLNIVVWERTATTYVLASSRLDVNQLRSLAANLKVVTEK